MDISKIPARREGGNVHVLVEIPRGSKNKYEVDEECGLIKLDRVLYSAVHYPTDYGFVPQTRSGDGELLDAMVMVEEPTFPGCLVEARIIGVLTIKHDSGLPEQKLLGVPLNEPRFDEYHDIADIPQHLLKEIEHFFEVFKDLQGTSLGVSGWEGSSKATQALDEAITAYQEDRDPVLVPVGGHDEV